ncbi:hypothetical protein [Pseudomonas sp. PDM19]|uniref:hypothetical protein n=1 Tax=Pseudomonas sp. PDM19 TaxID=2769272 RepID=UPI00177DDC75|nr:hypothetical protein [Pseudomonas sp. PDM19]MBD9629792.1 hypothetical protein [Pseudomonas sp. PDM19]
MNDYKSAFSAMAADIGAIIALLGFDTYPGVDPILRAITDLVLAKAETEGRRAERDAAQVAAEGIEAPTAVGALILGGVVSSTELGDNDVTLDSQAVERLQRELVKDSEDIAVDLMLVGQHHRILQALRAERDMWREAACWSRAETVDYIAARAKLLEERDAAQARVAELERSTVYVEARQCDECQHGGINDSADGLAACHDCDWTGPDPAEDKCPGCQSENCMAAACPQCGARYVLVASEEITAPVAQSGQVPDVGNPKWAIGTLREAVQYLDANSLNQISSGSVLHRCMRGALDAAAAPAQGGE